MTSLHPWANKKGDVTRPRCLPFGVGPSPLAGNNTTGEYPVGQPDAHVNPDDQDIHHYFGMAKVEILPPYELYHPVLPHRHKGKLTFPLCQACMEEEMGKPLVEKTYLCHHTPEQRTLRGKWFTPEIQKAVELGYTLIKIHEVHHFPPERRKVGLFGEYVNTWLKIKQESAGHPAWVTTPTDKAQYVHQYKRGKVSTSIPTSSPRTQAGRPLPNSCSTASGASSVKIYTNPPTKLSTRITIYSH